MAGPADKEVRLAEFQALREEIQQRSSSQHSILALYAASFSAIIGLALERDSPELLYIAPVLTLSAGLLWADHHRSIQRIGRYIRDVLWIWTPNWEKYREDLPKVGDLGFTLALYFFFFVTGFGTIAVAALELHGRGLAIPIIEGILLAGLTVWLAVNFD